MKNWLPNYFTKQNQKYMKKMENRYVNSSKTCVLYLSLKDNKMEQKEMM